MGISEIVIYAMRRGESGIDVVGTHSPATCSLSLCMNPILHLFHGHHCPEAESLLGIDVVGTHSPATCSLLLCVNAILLDDWWWLYLPYLSHEASSHSWPGSQVFE